MRRAVLWKPARPARAARPSTTLDAVAYIIRDCCVMRGERFDFGGGGAIGRKLSGRRVMLGFRRSKLARFGEGGNEPDWGLRLGQALQGLHPGGGPFLLPCGGHCLNAQR